VTDRSSPGAGPPSKPAGRRRAGLVAAVLAVVALAAAAVWFLRPLFQMLSQGPLEAAVAGGTAEPTVVAASPDPHLASITYAARPEESSAQLAYPNEGPATYRTGEVLRDGSVMDHIGPTFVVLRLGDARRRLDLDLSASLGPAGAAWCAQADRTPTSESEGIDEAAC
jgi:hypothetical protein